MNLSISDSRPENGRKSFFFFLVGSLVTFCLVVGVGWSIHSYEHKSLSNALLFYQLEKIENSKDVEVAFIGDSSLGNAIDSKYFSEISRKKTINVALSELFGVASNIHMLERVREKNPALKVAVFMHTYETMKTPIHYVSSIQAMTPKLDLIKSEFDQMKGYLKSFLQAIRSIQWHHIKAYLSQEKLELDIEAQDYLKQSRGLDHNMLQTLKPRDGEINQDYADSLQKLKKRCDLYQVQCVFTFGPYLETLYLKISSEFTKGNQTLILNSGMPLHNKPFFMKPHQIGDAVDHVSINFKHKTTAHYFNLLQQNVNFR